MGTFSRLFGAAFALRQCGFQSQAVRREFRRLSLQFSVARLMLFRGRGILQIIDQCRAAH